MRTRIFAAFALAGTLLAQAPARRTLAPVGLYNDYADSQVRAGLAREAVLGAAKQAGLGEGTVRFLALDLTAPSISDVMKSQRVYVVNEKLGDPAGFAFVAINNNGVYDIGDHAPMLPRTRLAAQLPVAAKLRILKGDAQVAEAEGTDINFTATETGAYRLEAMLGDKPWIRTAPIHLDPVVGLGVSLPPSDIAPTVEVKKDITYVEGKEADANKHKLDLYLPKGKTNFPVLIFIHGGSWRSGDRSNYPSVGNRFAKLGIGVVVPSYRLMPGAPHPAQIEDSLAAVDWVVKNIAQHGGDGKQLFLSGHSAGGHLAAYVGLEKRLWPNLKGVIALSGVYDVSTMAQFQGGLDGSPLHRIAAGAPPFLIAYVQNDYATLAAQARTFDAALRKAGVSSQLEYVPGRNHISEMTEMYKDTDPTALLILKFIGGGGKW